MMQVAIRRMTDKEARACVAKINDNMTNIRSLVLELYEREGWSAMGYASWRECVTAEFKQGQRHLYEQLEAAQTEKNICAVAQNIPERQLRPLTKLRNNPEKQKEAWQQAVDTAPDGKVTAAHVASVVKGMTEAEEPDENVVATKEDSRNLADIKTSWNACSAADKRMFVRWIWEYFGKYVVELFLQRIKTLHSTDDESDTLFQLKRRWMKATRTDKESLFSWLKEDR